MKDVDTRINFDQTCRVCLTEEKNMKSLFSVEQILENEIQLSDILMSCSSITVDLLKHTFLFCYQCWLENLFVDRKRWGFTGKHML